MICKDFLYKGLMEYFEQVSSIPRPSFKEEKIADYLCDFAKERGLEFYRDANHNVFIKKSGTVGRENEPAILLQGHTDMVCEKNEGTEHDFLSDGIELFEKNGWLHAKGTTLGADNGVAVAMMLYILDGAEGNLASHPPIECLFTSAEEVGLDGANAFDYSKVSAKAMINMDSADESQIICGCAGGQRTTLSCKLDRTDAVGEQFCLTVKGLAGGHSGEDINRGRANANKLVGRILQAVLSAQDIGLVSFNGGSKDNAIPRECVADVCVADSETFMEIVNKTVCDIRNELCDDDANFEFLLERVEMSGKKMITLEQTRKIIFFIATVQNGVIEMNRYINDLVDYSRNLGIVYSDDGHIEFTFMARSPKTSQIECSAQQLKSYAAMLGMEFVVDSEYPGWDVATESKIRDAYAQSYRKLYGKDPLIIAIHAGLECGIIKEKLPELDIISCGPIVVNLHSPDEAMDIKSFERFFAVIKDVLEQ